MWKKIIWSSATLIGSSFLVWTNKGIVIHLESQIKKSFENDDPSYIFLPENSGRAFYEDVESSWFPWMKNNTSTYWNLLMLSKSRKRCVRHRAISSLAELSDLDKWQYMMLAQACDSRTAVGLARSPGIDVSFFLSPPFRNLREENLKEEFFKLSSVPLREANICVELLVKRANILAHQLVKKQEDWNSEIEDSFKLYHSERRKTEEFAFDKVSLQALLGLSSMKSHRPLMLEKGVLKFLLLILKHHENETEFQSLIAQILANIAMEEASGKALHITGWIGILALWSKSPYVEVSLPAAKALANLDTDDFHHSYYDSGIYLLHPCYRQKSEKKPHVDIIFVHGLLGATFWTWRQHDSMKICNSLFGNRTSNSDVPKSTVLTGDISSQQYTFCWPKDWLAADFPDARIISIDYNTCITKWTAECPQQEEKDNLDAKAGYLIDKLLLSNIGENPIIWVAHSMGGLLIKEVLIQAAASKNNGISSIAQKTTGVIFFSVPHKGSDLANIFQSVPYIFQPSIDMWQLNKGSSKLLSLHKRFQEIVDQNNISVLSFAETKKSKWGLTLSLLVSEDSSDPGFGEFYALPVDHLSTCKPESKESKVYIKIIQFLQDNIPQPLVLSKKYSKVDLEVSNILCLI